MKIKYFFLFISFTTISFSQDKELIFTYNDSLLKKENLPISNGLFHNNSYNVVNNQNIYYKQEKYSNGNVNYLNQNYYELSIKYDSFNDDLIFRPVGESEKTGIILFKDNVLSFEVHKSKFINIEKVELENTKVTGYYEEGFSNSDFKFLIKHQKNKKDVYNQTILQNIFYEDQTLYILKDKKLKKITSKGSLKKLFPTKKDVINSYFEENYRLKKSDKLEFYKNLFKKI